MTDTTTTTEQDTTSNDEVLHRSDVEVDQQAGATYVAPEPTVNTETGDQSSEGTAIDEEPDTFPRSVVEKLRKENAGYRDRAKKAETYAKELFNARVAATGRLADPDDLDFDEALLDDHDALTAAVEELVARKPHLASRKPRGDVGAGATPAGGTVDLAALMRSRV